ncbi:MAG: alpha/beta hydrolase [Pseudomonadota bacterium]
MHYFNSDGVELAYHDEGEGEPIFLVHGFASNANTNWVFPSWFKTLTDAGYRVIAHDNRGHGKSEKLYNSELYSSITMAEDVRRLMDHLSIKSAYVMGYSMGTRITAYLCLNHPDRVKAAVFGGLGMGLVDGVPGSEAIADGLLADDPAQLDDPQAIAFRTFADQTKSDRKALAACIRESRSTISASDVSRITTPVLLAVGTEDDVAGDLDGLLTLLPNGEACPIPRRNHMQAVGDKVYKAGVLAFLSGQI